jgi:RNA polymerase sigma factor (TIGR02999 family)
MIRLQSRSVRFRGLAAPAAFSANLAMLDFSSVGHKTGAMVGEVTQILEAMRSGEATADELINLVYEELRRLASRELSGEPAGHTLEATALVHEAYLRLLGNGEHSWENRRHFFAAASEAMRRILVESARRKRADKRGGQFARHEFNERHAAESILSEELVAVDEALDRLAVVDEQAAALVKLRYFGGMTISECASVLGVSPRTADRLWAYAKAWLIKQMRDDETQDRP